MNEDKKLEVCSLVNENENKENKKEVWESCCIRTNPHAIAYIGQIIISILILASFNDLKIADLCTIWKMVVHSAKQITAPKFQKVMNDPSADPC